MKTFINTLFRALMAAALTATSPAFAYNDGGLEGYAIGKTADVSGA